MNRNCVFAESLFLDMNECVGGRAIFFCERVSGCSCERVCPVGLLNMKDWEGL